MIDAFATEPHFVDHLAPIWNALPESERGSFFANSTRAGNTALARARLKHKIMDSRPGPYRPVGDGICMVSATGDLGRVTRAAPAVKVVLTEHGCGLTYNEPDNSYVGAPDRPNVELFLFPNELCAARQRAVHPDREIVDLGSSPRLDRWVGLERSPNPRPVVAMSFHWDCTVVPETRSALYWYRKKLDLLLERGWEIIGHAHPRAEQHLKLIWKRLGVEFVADFEDVLARADLLAVDNSSVLYEFAATGRPVVAMNCPRYRRNVHHGLRFWEHVPGLQCDLPDELPDVIAEALADGPEARSLREAAVGVVFPRNDGQASVRAAEAVLGLL